MSSAASLSRGAASITVATAIARVTGFVRVVVVAAAMGTTFLANTYQSANTAPNIVFELVAAGVLTSIFVPTFVGYLVRGEREEGWDAANALTSVALIGLTILALLVALAAPVVMRLLTLGVEQPALREREIALGSTFLRLFAPQIVFYGAGMIMTAALHAHRRFALPAVAPIFNNVVVIGAYLAYALMRGNRPPTITGITTGETWVLGLGTTMGVVAMTLCLVPQLRRLGWRFRLRPETNHPAVRAGARLGAWALGYAGGYQAGLIVVLVLANRIEGGVAAYQWAYTFFYLPHALFAVPVFSVLFPAMSEHVAKGEEQGLAVALRDGLGILLFILIPISLLLVAAAEPLARVTLQYGVMTGAGVTLTANVIAAFAVGLPTYSTFLVMTRAFYAMSDARTPALVNLGAVAVASVLGALLFAALDDRWAVAGLALGHSIAFAGGTLWLARALKARVGSSRNTALTATIVRALQVGALALFAMLAVATILPNESRGAALLSLVATAAVGAAVYGGLMLAFGAPEARRLLALVRRADS